MKLTRRQLVIAAAGSMAVSGAAAQTVPAAATPPATATDPNQEALDDLRQNADDLAKITIPMDVAPAFQFKA